MNNVFFVSLLFGLQFLYWFVGKTSSQSVGKEEYFHAGRNISLFPLMMTFLATQIGGGVVLGAAEEAYRYGWIVLCYPLGVALGLILLGMGIGKRLGSFSVSTVAQIFEEIYGSPVLRKIASLLSILSLFMILVAQVIASHKFLISLGVTNILLFFAFWMIVILYTAKGGLKAVIATDVVQALFFSIVFIGCFFLVSYTHKPTIHIEYSVPFSKISGWVLMPLLFMIIEQDMAQRCFAGPRMVSKATLLSGIIVLFICIVPVFLGCLAKNLDLSIPSGGSVLMAAIQYTTNSWVASVLGCAVLAAIVSTATSLINAISSNLSYDFTIFRKKDVRLAKGLSYGIAGGAILFALYLHNILDLLIQSYELSVSCLLIPLVMALSKKQRKASAAFGAIIGGAFGFVLFRFYPTSFPKEIISLFFSLAGYGLGQISTKKSITTMGSA